MSIRLSRGFTKQMAEELRAKFEGHPDEFRNVVLVFDECKIKEGLVWRNGDIVGYADLGDEDLNESILSRLIMLCVLTYSPPHTSLRKSAGVVTIITTVKP